jgi:hypothetical protein
MGTAFRRNCYGERLRPLAQFHSAIGAGRPGSVIAGKSGLAGACVRGTILNAEMVPSAPKIKPIQSSMEETWRAREPEPSQARRANAASDHYAAGGRDGRLRFLQ